MKTGPFFLWEAKEKQTLSVMRSVVQTDGHLQYLQLCEQLLGNLTTCRDHWTLLLNLVALADIDGFLDGLWILGMPQSKGLIAHKELG